MPSSDPREVLTHYIELAIGKDLDAECRDEIAHAVDEIVAEAVDKAIAKIEQRALRLLPPAPLLPPTPDPGKAA